MPSRFTKRLLTHLAHDTYEPSTIERLARDLGIAESDLAEFEEAVRELASEGQAVIGSDESVTLPPLGSTIVGTFKGNPKGFGFIIPLTPNAHGDLFVPAGSTLDAVTGDVVKADVVRTRRQPGDSRSPYIGVVTEIIRRKHSVFTGTLKRISGRWMVVPDGKVLHDPVLVPDASSKNVKEGDKVVFEVTMYPEGSMMAEGVIVRVLGEAGKPDVETQAVIEAYGLPSPEFPEACVEQARRAATAFAEEIRRADESGGFKDTVRLDLRKRFVLTIDPPDAKDYDDAISIERLDDAGWSASPNRQASSRGKAVWRLGVHIADVANFIPPESPLDIEARDRANSCYLPRLVIPMLPEVLSNGICSLQERVPRYCKTVFIDYDSDGRVLAEGFANTIIHSAKRLTYIEAQALIDGNLAKAREHAKTEPNYTDELRWALKELDTLSKRIRERRRRAGMIHLDLPEVELVFDEEGHVVDAVPEDDSYTHTLIEMLMVEANEAVARLFEDLGVPILRRVHPEPVPGNMEGLRDFVKVAGYRIPKNPSREELQSLLDATAGTPAAPAVHFAVLRSLTRAEYSPALIGHFALASEAYAHFTSPIRRYPDLTVHRALAEYLSRTANGQKPPASDAEKRALGREMQFSPMCPDAAELQKIAHHCNYREEAADDAEHDLRAFLVLQLLTAHIGESFPALVTGVSNAGVFCRLDKFLAEGLIKTADLPMPAHAAGGKPGTYARGGSWAIDKTTGALVERKSGRSFNIGDRVEVTIAEIDLARRQMELLVTDPAARDVGKAKRLADRLVLGGIGGGLDHSEFKERTGAERRAARSKSRERNKSDYRSDRKGKGKRQ